MGAVFDAGSPTGSIFQLTIDEREGVTGTGQQPDNPGTLENSVPPPRVLPVDISIVSKSFAVFGRPVFHCSFSYFKKQIQQYVSVYFVNFQLDLIRHTVPVRILIDFYKIAFWFIYGFTIQFKDVCCVRL